MDLKSNKLIVLPLDKGGKRKFGNVYLISDPESGEKVVLKKAAKSQLSESAKSQFLHEQYFSFDQPGLPKVVGFEENDAHYYLLIAYKNGVDLQTYWEQLPKKERLTFTKRLIFKICVILDQIHQQSIFHCDIRPNNILIEEVDGDFDVHLIDFGLAVNHLQPQLNRSLLFPLGYAAPELLLHRLDLVNATTDYFSLGVTIYRLWNEKLPLIDPNPTITTNLQLAHPLPESSKISKSLFQVLKKMCAKPAWRTAPNRMRDAEVTVLLNECFNQRYTCSAELIQAFESIEEKKWWQF